MSRELDVRDFTRNRVSQQRATELQASAEAVSDRLPGSHRVRVARDLVNWYVNEIRRQPSSRVGSLRARR